MDEWPFRYRPQGITTREATPEERRLIARSWNPQPIVIPQAWHLSAEQVRHLCGTSAPAPSAQGV